MPEGEPEVVVPETEPQEPATDTPAVETSVSVEAEPVTASPDAADTPVEQALPEPSTASTVATSPTPEPKPWVPRVYGGDLPIPGAVVQPNGDVVIPAGQLANVQRFLANPDVIRQREVTARQEISRLTKLADPASNETTIRNNLVLNGMIQAHERGELLDWADRFFNDLPLLQAKAEAQAAKAQLQARDEYIQPIQQERQWAQMEPGFRDSLTATLQDVLADPENADIDRDALQSALWEQRRDLFRTATPEEKQEHGADWTIDPKHFSRELNRYRFFGKQLKEERARQQKTATAQAAIRPAGTQAPPQISTKGSAVPQATRKPKEPATAADWDDDWMKTPILGR